MRPIKIIRVGDSRKLEDGANALGVSYAQMMEDAGRCTAQVIGDRLPVRGRQVVVLIGPGNNGGDGLVAAVRLQEMGAQVSCYIWKRDLGGDVNLRRVEEAGLPVVWAKDDEGYQRLRSMLAEAEVLVDALLGVGVSRPIDGSLKEVLEIARAATKEIPSGRGLTTAQPCRKADRRALVVAVDCPTGLDCDSGALDASALRADVTVTFAYPKRGLLRFPGAEAVGDLVVADIGIPAGLADDEWPEMVTAERVRSWLPERPPWANKGTFGKALVVAGSVSYTGAAALAGAAATRVGTGLVTLAVPAPIQLAVAARVLETTYVLLPHDLGVIAPGAVDVLRGLVDSYDALLVGPGLTQEVEAVRFVHELLRIGRPERHARIGFVTEVASGHLGRPSLPPLVLDADGLNALAQVEGWYGALPRGTILTPHPGEMARLVGSGTTVRDIQEDREGCCRRMAGVWGCVVVLKGAFTVVAAPDGRVAVTPFANAGLATAGSGDVLAGAIAGLRAQGVEAYEAAATGAYVHALAGELVRAELGDMGTVAGDLIGRLPLALRNIRQASQSANAPCP